MTGMTVDECDEVLTALTRQNHVRLEIDGGAPVYLVP
jgi:hypothetical protein